MHLQSKLLRVLQERQLTRLGGQTLIPLNVRFIAATNKDLRHAIAQREFREDLYYRIATFRLTLQPLRERPGDIIPLALHSLNQTAQAGRPWQIHAQAQTQLLQYPWPGNVRELENVVKRAVVLCTGRTIAPMHLMFDDAPTADVVTQESSPQVFAPTESAPMAQPVPVVHEPAVMFSPMEEADNAAINLQHAVKTSEHQIIMAALQTTESREEAARKLGISPRTLRYKLAQLREMGLGLQATHTGVAS